MKSLNTNYDKKEKFKLPQIVLRTLKLSFVNLFGSPTADFLTSFINIYTCLNVSQTHIPLPKM